MIKFTQNTHKKWQKARIDAKCMKPEKPEWVPKFPLKRKLPGAHDKWSKEEWDTSGFPCSKIPKKFPTMLNEKEWDDLVKEVEVQGLLPTPISQKGADESKIMAFRGNTLQNEWSWN